MIVPGTSSFRIGIQKPQCSRSVTKKLVRKKVVDEETEAEDSVTYESEDPPTYDSTDSNDESEEEGEGEGEQGEQEEKDTDDGLGEIARDAEHLLGEPAVTVRDEQSRARQEMEMESEGDEQSLVSFTHLMRLANLIHSRQLSAPLNRPLALLAPNPPYLLKKPSIRKYPLIQQQGQQWPPRNQRPSLKRVELKEPEVKQRKMQPPYQYKLLSHTLITRE
jgi:hypothetical protein